MVLKNGDDIKNKNTLIHEEIIKGLLEKGNIKKAVKLAERVKMSGERFGEIFKVVESDRIEVRSSKYDCYDIEWCL